MLKSLFSIGVLLLAFAPSAAGDQGLVEQDLFVQLLPQEHRLLGHAVLTAPYDPAGLPGKIQLASTAEIESLTVDGSPVPYTFANGMVQVDTGNRSGALEITYRARFDDPVPQDTAGIEDPSYGIAATIMPQGSFLSASSGWHPVPVGRLSRFRVTILAPPAMIGVTTGRLVTIDTDDRESRTVWQTRLPQASLALAAGEFQVGRDDLDGIQLLTFMGGENAGLAEQYLASCRKYLQLYKKLFGAYPYAKFAVVENFFPTGYGLPGWTLLGSNVIRLPFIRSTSLPHEIAHAWWGNAVEVDYQSGNWCEGLATYVADYYLKELYQPAEALEYRRKILRDYASLIKVGNDLPLRDFRSRTTKLDQAVGYGKAAMVFHMLRQLIGDQAFWNGLKEIARQGRGKRYAWSDLQHHFEQVSARKLGFFFQQWIDRSGAPQLELSNVKMDPVNGGWQVAGRLRQDEPVFDLTIPLRLTTDDRVYRQQVLLHGAQTGFAFKVADRPTGLAADPDYNLFRRLFPQEIPATVNHLRASRMPLVVVAHGAESLIDASRDLLRGLQWKDAPVMSEADYIAQQPSGRDVLFLGWPQNASLRQGLPANVKVADHQFTLAGHLYADSDDVLFMVLDSPEKKQVRAFFLPGSLAAAQDTARRIPHYGGYSVLVFRAGQNLVKSTWEADESPLKLRFNQDTSP